MDFFNSDFSASDPSKSGAFKKLGADATKNLTGSQKKALYETLKKYKGSSSSIEKALGELDLRKDDGIDAGLVRKIKTMTGAGKLNRSGYYADLKKNHLSKNNGSVQRSSYAPISTTKPAAPAEPNKSHFMQTLANNNSRFGGGGLIKPNR